MSALRRRLVLLLALCLAPIAWPQASPAQGSCEFMSALTLGQILELANGFVPAATITGQIAACGVTFILDDDGVRQIRGGRASTAVKDELIAKLGPPSTPATGARWTPYTDRREMAWIPPGEFQMGSPSNESGRDDDEALHPVRLGAGFWMDTTEVTNEAFRRFLLSQHQWSKGAAEKALVGGEYLKDWNGDDFPSGAGRRPVVYVSWHAARAYALWAGKRLPTEAEWEYAARAGTSKRYWWGDDIDHRKANNGRDLWPAGRTDGGIDTRNGWGLQDMLGNAAEWTSSLKRDYPYRATDGRESPDGNGDRALRGGGYSHGDAFLRVANRSAAGPSSSIYNVGFRCAR